MSTISNTTDALVRVLADGSQIPLLGLGVWQVPNGPTIVNAVRWALELCAPPTEVVAHRRSWRSRSSARDRARR
jgi:hypothetical protein